MQVFHVNQGGGLKAGDAHLSPDEIGALGANGD